jgi:DNA-binding transcriptional regulator YiaG
MMEIRGTASTYMPQYETLDKTTEEKDIQEEIQSSEKDQFVKSDETGKAVTYNKVKKLTPDQIKALREQQDAAKADMLKRMMQVSLENQANNYGMSEKSRNLIKEIFGSLEEGIPPLETSPEEAKKAI